MTVVVDAGVWISALHFKGAPLEAVEHALRHGSVGVCPEIAGEIRKALVGKFRWRDGEAGEQLARYLAGAIWIERVGNLHGVCRDPKDDMVLECTGLGAADLIVTGDRDLLVLNSFRNIQIITARQYLDSYA